jgi:hypothetical protein
MNRSRHIAVVVCFVFVMASAASAQMGMRQTPMPRGLFNPVVGSGAQYEIQSGSAPKTTVEFAVVGKDSVNGKDAYWLEWTVTGTQMGDIIMKVQMVPDGSNTSSVKTIMQMGNNPPMEMPAGMMGRGNTNTSQPADIRGQAEDVGSESITTRAGTFTCEHYRAKDGSGDTWVSEKVSPFGVVKSQGKDTTMVLTKVVTDATDKITGTPQPFNPMMMMGRR